MLAPPVVENRVTPTLGWPRSVEVDPQIGWPTVPRETLDWPEAASAAAIDSGASDMATAAPMIELPPRPRRAICYGDELGSPAVDEEPTVLMFEECMTTASLPASQLP